MGGLDPKERNPVEPEIDVAHVSSLEIELLVAKERRSKIRVGTPTTRCLVHCLTECLTCHLTYYLTYYLGH